ncbi:MAG TPA: hypothetical protein VFH89_00275 [Sphingomicrobium sp.]|nr:hypothetical protein [Sphingomicrobium sp.]
MVGVDVNEALSQMASRWHIPKLALLPDESCEEQQEDLQPAAIGEEKKPKPRSKPKRTSLDRIPGRRPMKEYPVTGEELLTLGIMQGGAALMLAFAGTCFGFFLSTQQTIDFAGKEVSQATVGWWEGMGDAALALAIITCLLGIALGVLSGFKVSRIMKNTDHG